MNLQASQGKCFYYHHHYYKHSEFQYIIINDQCIDFSLVPTSYLSPSEFLIHAAHVRIHPLSIYNVYEYVHSHTHTFPHIHTADIRKRQLAWDTRLRDKKKGGKNKDEKHPPLPFFFSWGGDEVVTHPAPSRESVPFYSNYRFERNELKYVGEVSLVRCSFLHIGWTNIQQKRNENLCSIYNYINIQSLSPSSDIYSFIIHVLIRAIQKCYFLLWIIYLFSSRYLPSQR